MSTLRKQVAMVVAAAITAGCGGDPVLLGSQVSGPIPAGPTREVQAEGCGFHLLGVIPINVNDRQSRAYEVIQAQASGGFITDVSVTEKWTWLFVGNLVCTTLQAKVLQASAPKGAAVPAKP